MGTRQPSLEKSYREKSPIERRFAAFFCMWIGHSFIELEKGYVETVDGSPRQVFKRNKVVCRSCGTEFGVSQ